MTTRQKKFWLCWIGRHSICEEGFQSQTSRILIMACPRCGKQFFSGNHVAHTDVVVTEKHLAQTTIKKFHSALDSFLSIFLAPISACVIWINVFAQDAWWLFFIAPLAVLINIMLLHIISQSKDWCGCPSILDALKWSIAQPLSIVLVWYGGYFLIKAQLMSSCAVMALSLLLILPYLLLLFGSAFVRQTKHWRAYSFKRSNDIRFNRWNT